MAWHSTVSEAVVGGVGGGGCGVILCGEGQGERVHWGVLGGDAAFCTRADPAPRDTVLLLQT